MKNKLISKVIFAITFIIIVSGLCFNLFVLKKSYAVSDNYINTLYNKPIVNIKNVNSNTVVFKGGLYRYGDITKDGIINEADLNNLDFYLKKYILFSDNQKELADLNGDNVVDNGDLEIFRNYLDNNEAVQYDISDSKLLYCLNTSNTTSNCNWKDNKFSVDKEDTYYVFVKKDNNISDVLIYNYKKPKYESEE